MKKGAVNPPRRECYEGMLGGRIVNSRAAIGAARWRSRPRRRSVDRAMLRLDFLRLYATEDVVLKRLWPAEELCFGSAHLHARIEFEGNHVQCADEIRFC